MSERKIPQYCIILTAVFVAATLAGFFAPIPGKMDLFGDLRESFGPFLELSPWKLFFFLLLNSSAKSFMVMLAGILFGLIPVIAVASNGYILGIAYLFASGEIGYVKAGKMVLPHGVLEIPAVILSAAYGLWLGVMFTRRIRQRDMTGFGKEVRHAIRVFFLVAFPLFLLAAAVETILIDAAHILIVGKIFCVHTNVSICFIDQIGPAPNLRLEKACMGKFTSPIPHSSRLILMLCTLVPLLFSSCGGGSAAQRKSTNEWLNSNIGIATVDDLIADMGPPGQSIETPEGTWYTWRKVKSGGVFTGSIGGGSGGGFFGLGMGTPVETGEELNCLFDRNTGRLKNYKFREW